MRRREFIALSGAAALAMRLPALAQQPEKLPRIAILGNSTAALEANLVGAFRDGLRELGYVQDRTILIEYRWAEGRYERLPSLVGELVRAKAAVIVTAGTPAALAVTKTAPSVPLVMVAVGDPIGTGLVESLARPGGNATGLTSITPELEGKRLELIRDMVPGVRRLALLWNPANAYQLRNEKEVQAAAAALGLPVLSLAVRNVEELDTAFAAILKEGANTMLVLADRVFLHNRDRIAAFAGENRLPMMSAYRELAEAGGLMSFGPSYAVMHKQAARYVDRILKGAKPAELPVEQPAKFEFVLNLKAAQALGLTSHPRSSRAPTR
jgi:putative tryptophan/tyrosine transport system substrate-binding protein